MDKELITSLKTNFDNMSHYDEKNGIEFWYARELQSAFEYTEWRNFQKVIEKAKVACLNSEHETANHFVDVTKMVGLGSGAQADGKRNIDRQIDFELFRMNKDADEPEEKDEALG